MSNWNRKLKNGALLVCCFLGLSLFAVPARATLIVNGMFNATGSPTADDQLTTNVPGWTSTGYIDCFIVASSKNRDLCNNSWNISLYQWPGGTAPPGNYIMADGDPAYEGAITQNITGLTAGHTYKLTFYQAAGQQSGFTGSSSDYWKVSLGNETHNSATMSVAFKGSAPWSQQSITFTATNTSELLSFLAVGAAGTPPFLFLGDVSLTEMTPEPSTFSLLLLGVVLCVPAVRKSRKRRL